MLFRSSRTSGFNFATKSEAPPQRDGIVKAGTGALSFCHRHPRRPSPFKEVGLLRPFHQTRAAGFCGCVDGYWWRIGLGEIYLTTVDCLVAAACRSFRVLLSIPQPCNSMFIDNKKWHWHSSQMWSF